MPTLNSFQEHCVGLLSPQTTATKEGQLINGMLGLSGEAGECADIVKKGLFHGHELDKEKLKLELGDALFYLASSADAIDTTLEDIALLNMQKLQKRYPKGAFDVEDSKAKKDRESSNGNT